jgi:hypothetical protein
MMIIKPTFVGAIAAVLLSSCTISEAQVSTPKKVLIVLTNHAQLGNTGKPTGFYCPSPLVKTTHFSGRL